MTILIGAAKVAAGLAIGASIGYLILVTMWMQEAG